LCFCGFIFNGMFANFFFGISANLFFSISESIAGNIFQTISLLERLSLQNVSNSINLHRILDTSSSFTPR
jgi:hypothetical protein